METDRYPIIFLGPVPPCGDHWQVWGARSAIYVGAACADCQKQILEVIESVYPGSKVTVLE